MRTNIHAYHKNWLWQTAGLLLACLFMLGVFLPASAHAQEDLRQSIRWDGVNAPLLNDFEGYTVIGWQPIKETGWGFVSLKKGDHNILVGFTQADGQWTRQFINEKAFPQGEMRMMMQDVSGGDRFSVQGDIDYRPFPQQRGKSLMTFWSNGEYYENLCVFELDSQGIWQLSFYAHAGQAGMMDITADTLYFLEETKSNAVIKARVGRDLRSFDLAKLPKNPRQARQPDALPPTIPAGFLEAQEIELRDSGLHPVYSAPDKASLRGAGGKAVVSGRGWVQVFGREGEYLLVLYAVNPGHYRIGYVHASALSEYWEAPDPLDFTRTPAKALHSTALTDDPLGSGQPLLTLKAGQEVTLLSTMGGFVYLETKQGNKPARSFAPLAAFDAVPQPAVGLRLATLQTEDGEVKTVLKHYSFPKLGLSFWADSQRLEAYEQGNLIRVVPRRNINDDAKLLSIYPAQVALYSYDWQRRYQAGEDMENPAAGLGMTEDGQPTYPPVPPLAELTAQAQAFYTWDAWRIQEMGAELAGLLPAFPSEAKTGFYAYKGNQVCQVLCLETNQGSFVCVIEYPQEAALTWGARLLYALGTLELTKQE